MLLGSRMLFISITNKVGKFVSGGFFTHFNKLMQYHLGATVTDALYLSPSKLMMDYAIQLALQQGAERLHLGGGLGGSTSDGLFRFKKGFGRQYHPFSSLRFIHQPEQYNKLRYEVTGKSQPNDYFPEYRLQTG